MSSFCCLPGANALSAFRQQRLLASLAAQGIQLESIQAQYLHFIWSESELSAKSREVLESLLTYGQPFELQEEAKSWFGKGASKQTAITIPRFGTVSPWASKATDIARQCGLDILRIERGVQYAWQSKKSLSAQEEQLVLAALHDRMTEAVISDVNEASALYQSLPDQP
ncbi:MAG: hypothetical protein B7X83_08685, partial [Polynucleobacter sp. 17-46-58]